MAAGAVARALLKEYGISVRAWSAEIAGIKSPYYCDSDFDLDQAEKNGLFIPCSKTAELVNQKIDELRAKGDSAGGIVFCRAEGIPAGLGEPVFDKLDAMLAQAIISIGAVKGIEIGRGFAVKDMLGSENNDIPPPLKSKASTNNSGGILGGISTGMALEFSAAIKPVPSISIKQKTYDSSGRECDIEIAGRHDICICPRAVPVIEAMTALVLADLLLQNRAVRLHV
ncbi:MAG: hypothetical protein Ta2F_07570 [Termitinemataceae bacterium]|nr:MAG: hypothetical protein Ta2F_07570 [Termitinemataceae bacterium]